MKKRDLCKRIISVIVLSMSIILLNACNKDDDNDDEDIVEQINYSNAANWVAYPDATKAVDVFYVYPTVSSNATGAMDINNEEERALAQGIFKAQASVFEGDANVFAPYYRQMSTKVNMPESGLATDTEEFKRGSQDVQQAFDYFIENLNKDRPFIIAGHSQGTMALIELIQNRFGNDEELRNRLVAAYLIGYTVTDEALNISGLAAAQSSNDVGVVVTYNTQSVTSLGGPMLMPGANCINPLNWKTDNTYADSSMNLGAVFFDDATGTFLREVQYYCGAKINTEKGALTTTIPQIDADTLEFGPYKEGVYHRYDYAFWYRNLEKNVGSRIEAYFEN